ncbi:hypothetical protein [Saccharibacillus endophyticus]|uniref:Uncharacterized protein n=1 Tax=Saccharibacillus endophyticus TaxID=2060666 RepID=A0ABQ1ZM59_9BACL|nr:hypothetical protein [Saccharibacillus endophyticus]GGH68670.1 hypothetical protein GCM10007362_02920 [Saccharibacillus endophyticus]
MRRKIQVLFVAACAAMIVSACADPSFETEPSTASSTSDTTEKTEKQLNETPLANNNTPEMTSGVNIDWDDIDSPLWNEEMREELETVLHAIVDKDAEALNKGLGPDVQGVFDYMLQNEYDFQEVSSIHEEYGKVLVQVGSILGLEGETPKPYNCTFYFEQDETGEWRIVSID